MKEYQTFLHHAYQKRSRFEPGAPQSIICSCAPEYQYFLYDFNFFGAFKWDFKFLIKVLNVLIEALNQKELSLKTPVSTKL